MIWPFFSRRIPADAPMIRCSDAQVACAVQVLRGRSPRFWSPKMMNMSTDIGCFGCVYTYIYINTYNYTLYCIYIYVYLRIPVSWRNLSFSVLTWHVVMWQVLMNVVASEIKVGFGSPSKSMDPLGTSRHCIDRSPGWKLWLGSIIIHYNPLLLVLLVTIGITSTIMNT